MADAACGPSNALQNFRKQTSADRSLQQDRLAQRTPSQPQSFRSQPRNPGVLDHDFEAFQAGLAQPHFPAHDPALSHFARPPLSAQQFQPAAGGWANEFSKLHISPQQPSVMDTHPMARAAAANPMGGWQQDFQRQHTPQPPLQPSAFQSPTSSSIFAGSASSAFFQPQMMHQPHFSPDSGLLESPSAKGKARADPAGFDEAFDREFERFAEQNSRELNFKAEMNNPDVHIAINQANMLHWRARSAETQQDAVKMAFQMLQSEQHLPPGVLSLAENSSNATLGPELEENYARTIEIRGMLDDWEEQIKALGGRTQDPAVNITALQRLDNLLYNKDRAGLRDFFSQYHNDIHSLDHLLGPEPSEAVPQNPEEAASAIDADHELAMVAGKVATTLGENSTEKFKNSEFLKFMREINTYEKVFRGDQVLDTRSVSTEPPPPPP